LNTVNEHYFNIREVRESGPAGSMLYRVGITDSIVQHFERWADVAIVELNFNAHLTSAKIHVKSS